MLSNTVILIANTAKKVRRAQHLICNINITSPETEL